MSKADDIFWREFGVILVLITAFGFAMFFLARSIGGAAVEAQMNSPSAVAERIAPVAAVRVGEPGAQTEATMVAAAAPAAPAAAADDSGGEKSGEDVYNSACLACHVTGAANAPKVGDKAAWEPRVAQGFETLLESAVKGKGAMPPKGGIPSLTEPEIQRAIEFMLEQTGLEAG